MTDERTPGGSPVLRHERVERPAEPAVFSSSAEEVEELISGVLGKPDTVLHEIVSDRIHLDVHIIRPSDSNPWWTLFTVGMSSLPMTVPESSQDLRFAELVLRLPASWPVDSLGVTPLPPDLEEWYWPIRGLKWLARLPHDHDTWLGAGHTIPNGDPPEPFANGTSLCAWLILPVLGVANDPQARLMSDGSPLHLYGVHAIHPDELELKLNEGTGALLDRLERNHVSDVLEPDRPSALARADRSPLRRLFRR